jgi:bifunctional DNA-binding transcriptional regulator/antitoxin component of YhaV-PrlF toxin-antitoxin module
MTCGKTPEYLTNFRNTLYLSVMVKTRVSSKGQTTIPSHFRKRWKTSQVFWEIGPKGTAVVRPVPDAMSLLGIAGNGRARDPHEMEKAQQAIAEDANERPAK